MFHSARSLVAFSLLFGMLTLSTGCATLSQFPAPFILTKKQLNTQMSLARVQEEQGDVSGAKKIYEQIVSKKPKCAAAHQRLAIIAVKHGKPETAEEHFQIARKAEPENLQLLNDIGYFYYLQNRLVDAEQTLREVVDEDPGQVRAVNNLGLVIGLQGRTNEAYDMFRKVGNESDAQANLAFVFAQLGDVDRAQFHYSKALTHNPHMKPAAQALVQIAEVCQRQRQHQAFLASQTMPAGSMPHPVAPAHTNLNAAQAVNHTASIATLPTGAPVNQQVPYIEAATPHPNQVQPAPYYPAPTNYPSTAEPQINHYPTTAPQPPSTL